MYKIVISMKLFGKDSIFKKENTHCPHALPTAADLND